ncbi:hypothetical protein [Burkholderia cenocepacia]|uniref:hypothetical protein n=1 Tax=Burkholderia cenocepacia TaxID=95486 RepID=UPI0006AC6999|nr:hypothetical protein [Burkholderia cenocepacia]KOR22951.1 hypothetical protein ABW54_03915 [Burkholderia cenocepacia]
MRKNGEFWTAEDDATLREIYSGNGGARQQMWRLPGRTFPAVRSRASKLKIVRRPPVRPYSKEEDDIIREGWRIGRPSKETAQMVGRGHTAVRRRADILGLTGKGTMSPGCKFSWVELEIRRILSDGFPRTIAQLSRQIGCTPNAVYLRLRAGHGVSFRVADFDNVGRHWAGMWELGSGPDAVNDKVSTAAQTSKRARDRKKLREMGGPRGPFSVLIQQVTA